MTGPLRILHEGEVYEPFEPPQEWPQEFELGWDSPEQEAHARLVLAEGTFIDTDGEPVSEAVAERTRRVILGTPSLLSARRGLAHLSGESGRRHLFDGLWPWGTYPMLGGAPKAGKTTLIADLVAALRVPDRRFLGRYAATLTEDERAREVWVFNAETPAVDFDNALSEAGVDPDDQGLRVIHLDEEGGPGLFDITDPEKFAFWAHELLDACEWCDGSDYSPPGVVIVDGVAAIAGSQVRYAEWYAAFKRLMKAADVPNGIATGHAVGDHLYDATTSMAGPDGVWIYTPRSPDDAASPRYFSVLPRMGGTRVPKSRVYLDAGRLSLEAPKRQPSSEVRGIEATEADAGESVVPASEEPEEDRWRSDVLARLQEAGADGALTKELTGSGRYGTLRRDALRALEAEGVVVKTPEGLGARWRLSEFD